MDCNYEYCINFNVSFCMKRIIEILFYFSPKLKKSSMAEKVKELKRLMLHFLSMGTLKHDNYKALN